MHSFLLQDLTTIRGTANNTVIQGEDGWLDLSAYQDLVFWVDVRNITGVTVTILFMTSPTKDDALFTNIIGAFTLTSGTVTQKLALMSGGSTLVPVARFVRWQLV